MERIGVAVGLFVFGFAVERLFARRITEPFLRISAQLDEIIEVLQGRWTLGPRTHH